VPKQVSVIRLVIGIPEIIDDYHETGTMIGKSHMDYNRAGQGDLLSQIIAPNSARERYSRDNHGPQVVNGNVQALGKAGGQCPARGAFPNGGRPDYQVDWIHIYHQAVQESPCQRNLPLPAI